ncbi:MAG: hypothetical protein JJ903_15125 [Spongiibacter sp.]|uniref:hypothetical protein n=1 Tax=Spongiibacter TaxID=630749 RepID=UPI001B11081D|nr:hypothetical protein [Spongiibacter sp.]MBO6754398.1 hypothetical protein [Spongiibacter sp.]
MDIQTTTPAPEATGDKGKCSGEPPHFTPFLPPIDTLPGLAIGLMLLRKEVCQRSMAGSSVEATRCAAYIQRLESDFNFQGLIEWRDLPYDKQQLKRRNRKPFRAYWLKPETIADFGSAGQEYARQALACFGVKASQFQCAPLQAKRGG